MVHRRRATKAVERRDLEAPTHQRTRPRIERPNRNAMKGLTAEGHSYAGAALDAMPILRRGFFIMGVIVVFLVLFCRNWLLSLTAQTFAFWYTHVCRKFLSRDLAVVPL